MADAAALEDPLSSLPIPPLSPFIFSDDLTFPEDILSFDLDDLGITFDDQHQHHPSDAEQLFNSTVNQSNPFDLSSSDPHFFDFVPDHETVAANSGNLLGNQGFDVADSGNLSGNQGYDAAKSGNSSGSQEFDVAESGNLLGNHGLDISRFVNIQSPDDCGIGFVEEIMNPVRISENSPSEMRNEDPVSSQGSGTCGFAESEAAVICTSSDSGNSVVNNVKREARSNFILKRKNESLDVSSECRTVKQQRSNEGSTTTENLNEVNEEDDKKKARLIRNRESAQLSRQRKKQYVEELEDKVRAMHATIQDLNARISYIAAENATLKQQMVTSGGGVCSHPVMYPPHPAMAPMGYPWMPYPPYPVKSHGSEVPLLPIPRLKTQQPASSRKTKTDVKKTEGTSKTKTKTKKVASISFLGLLLFIVLFGGLVPIMNVKFGGVKVNDGGYLVKPLNDYKSYNQHHGRVLTGDEHVNGTNHNASEPLVASLYVPRNDKLVKIDGNLIISSVLASEKAMASREEQETTLDLVPAIPIPTVKRNDGRQPYTYRTASDHQRALPSNEENLQPKHADGKPQQWFREGLSGLMLSSGMCTEVFQFDASVAGASGAIVPATSLVNITATPNRHNTTSITTVKNRRILHGLPIPLSDSTTNITKEQVAGHDSKHEDHLKNKSVSSMVVSVLVDPREAGDGSDLDGMMGGGGGGKGTSFSRIFVVVLLDSVKYVTYSCMLPLKGASHLVAA
ncbi:putative transcription factor bZIP family [Helianthus annuus]|nr:putative transcription factor bZIP family [Helianthus annuus]KAJ0798829.1 putative transcription factor bZIP family [Helianthus annuus]